MQYYLIRLAYTAAAWKELIEKTKTVDDRLDSVRKLIRELGGSLANFHFFDDPHFQGLSKPHVVIHKFVPFGKYDILTVIAMPDHVKARGFSMAVAAEEGVKNIEMTPLMTLEEGVQAMAIAKTARSRAKYVAPGSVTRRRR